MGTRNLTMVIKEERIKVAQYAQYDGYPGGVGSTILDFLQRNDIKKFGKMLDVCKFYTKEEIKQIWAGAGADGSGFVSMGIAQKIEQEHPELYRNTGPDVLQMIYDGNLKKLDDNREFVNDSLFCEWAYVVDLDKNTFEVYKGFNTTPLTKEDRFYDLSVFDTERVLRVEKTNNKKERRNEYHPVKMIQSFDLNNLPDYNEFVNLCEPVEEEEY